MVVRGSISACKSTLGALEKKGRTKETLSRGPFGDASHGTFVVGIRSWETSFGESLVAIHLTLSCVQIRRKFWMFEGRGSVRGMGFDLKGS